MRHEAAFLRDILSASRKIEAITAATSEEAFLLDEVLPAAILHHLTVMGHRPPLMSTGTASGDALPKTWS